MKYRLQLQLASTAVDIESERVELVSAISHIYRAFSVDQQTRSTEAPNQVIPDSLNDGSVWRFAIDKEEYQEQRFDRALRSLEDGVADCLLEAVSDCLLIHAGAVTLNNMSYIIVGQSGSGKTTTTLEFLRRGYLYLTDEFTAVKKNGTGICPFPRSATRKYNSPTPAGSILEVPEEDGFRSHMLPDNRAGLESRALHSCRIIFPRHSNGCTPKARLLDSAEICCRLMPSIFDFEGREIELWPALSNLVTSSQGCEFEYNSAEADLDIALNLFK